MNPTETLTSVSRMLDIFGLRWQDAYEFCFDNPNRPEWSLLPLAECIEMLDACVPPTSTKKMLAVVAMANNVSCLGQWRLTQDVVRFDPTLKSALLATPIPPEMALPSELFFRAGSWCQYIEHETDEYSGFFWAIDPGERNGDAELRVWWQKKGAPEIVSTMLHLDEKTVEEAIGKSEQLAEKYAEQFRIAGATRSENYNIMSDALNLILYLCAQNAEYDPEQGRPSRSSPKKVKRGIRFFPADKPKIWSVGKQTGNRLKQEQRETAHRKDSVRPHIRRAHWHGFWSGPMTGERKFEIKWLPPIFVGGD